MGSPIEPRLADAERRLFTRCGVQVSERYVDLRRPRMRVRVLESGEGAPVLFLHGVSLTSAHWAPLLARLGSFRCLAVDLPGHGRSDRMDFRRIDVRRWYVKWTLALLDSLELDSPPFVGHSLGGMIALWLALEEPARVRAIAALGSPAGALPGTRADALLTLLATPGLNRLALSFPAPLPVYRALLARSTGRLALRLSPREVVETSYLASRLPGAAASVASFLPRVLRGSVPRPETVVTSDELRRIEQPVLLVLGHRDPFCPLGRVREAIGLLPDGRLEVVEGGHEPWLDDPATCADLVSRFL